MTQPRAIKGFTNWKQPYLNTFFSNSAKVGLFPILHIYFGGNFLSLAILWVIYRQRDKEDSVLPDGTFLEL